MAAHMLSLNFTAAFDTQKVKICRGFVFPARMIAAVDTKAVSGERRLWL